MEIRLLVIDDDIDVLTTLETTFTTMTKGFTVFTATTANGGYNILKDKKPDVVILDIRLGPKSGMDLLREFRDYFNHPTTRQDTPRYVVITAYPDEKIEKEAREVYKVDAFLTKPIDRYGIRRAVMICLGKVLKPYNDLVNTYSSDKADSCESPEEKKAREWRDKKIDEDIRSMEEHENQEEDEEEDKE